MTIARIKFLIKKILIKKSPSLNCFIGELHQKFQKELILMLSNLIQKIEEEEIVPTSFYETSIIMMLETKKEHTHQRKNRPTSLITLHANLLYIILSNWIQ